MSTNKNENFTPLKITPGGRWFNFGAADLIRYREVLYLLVWRDVKVRYRQTLLGIFWVILQPLLATLLFTIIFSQFARFETGKVPYVVIALSGFTVWLFVNSTVTQAAASLVYHEQLVTKIYFPRLFVPSSLVIAGLPDLALTLPLLIVVLLYFGFLPTVGYLFIPLALILIFVTALSVSVLLSALNVRFRDVKFVTPFFLQVWMFGSPVFYPASWIPDSLQYVFAVNPLSGAITLFRHSLLGTPVDWMQFGISTLSLICVSVFAIVVFKRMEDDFADHL